MPTKHDTNTAKESANDAKAAKQLHLDLRYLRMARIWAENSYCQRRKVGALVVKDKMIISDGYKRGVPSRKCTTTYSACVSSAPSSGARTTRTPFWSST